MSIRQSDEGKSSPRPSHHARRKHANSGRRKRNAFGTDPSRTIYLSSFPPSTQQWRAVPLTPVVIASTLHRTFKIRTDANMIVFHEGGRFCSVELGCPEDARLVLRCVQNGVLPTLHHRDITVVDWALEVDSNPPELKRHTATTTTTSDSDSDAMTTRCPGREDGRTAGEGRRVGYPRQEANDDAKPTRQTALLRLTGLPGAFNRDWEGVRMTEVVVASMLHKTYGVQTRPDLVSFNSDRTGCTIDLECPDSAQRVLSLFRRGKVPVLHHRLDPSSCQSKSSSRAVRPSGFSHRLAIVVSDGSNDWEDPSSNNNNNTGLSPSTSSTLSALSPFPVETGVLRLTGLPGLSPPWRFLNGSVVASCIYRLFGVQTFPDMVSMSADRTHCDIELALEDARHVLRRVAQGERIVLHHRDHRIPSLTMTAALVSSGSVAVATANTPWLPPSSTTSTSSSTTSSSLSSPLSHHHEEAAAAAAMSWSQEWQRLMEDKGGVKDFSALHPSWTNLVTEDNEEVAARSGGGANAGGSSGNNNNSESCPSSTFQDFCSPSEHAHVPLADGNTGYPCGSRWDVQGAMTDPLYGILDD